jgi:hypothetical protein
VRQLLRFVSKNNLTEINHKVSVYAKRYFLENICANAQECHGGQVMDGENKGLNVRDSLRELNRRYLGLAALAGGNPPLARAAGLSPDQLAAAADCPYALFDLRFGDAGHWLARLQGAPQWYVADSPQVGGEAVEFVRLALFFVWHVATSAPLHAQLLLGMPRSVAAAFALLTVDRLPGIAIAEAGNLAPRWQSCNAYWNALIDAAANPSALALRRAQLRGIQFAAAVRLLQRPIAAGGP